jgi:DNA-binding GntR family transcriptional regulator
MKEDRVGIIARTLRNAIIEQAIKPGTHWDCQKKTAFLA